jgi:type I restriction enzyme, S subunit
MEVMEPSTSHLPGEGYKRTEVGVIPTDWEVTPLHSLAEKITVGIANAATHAYRDRGVVMFRNQNIKPNHLDDRDVLYIDELFEQRYRNKRLKAGDLLTARTGYPGTTSIVPAGYDGAQTFTTLITRPRKTLIDPQYLCFFINSDAGQRYIEQSQAGGGQKNVNAGSLKFLNVALPPTMAEQKSIAEALSDADALIESLEQLLLKKRQIKQGAMQELPTGKKRLPGFSGEWEVKRLGELGSTFGGLSGKTRNDFGHGAARYITFMNIMSNVVIDCDTFEFVEVRASESQNRVAKGDLFFNGSSETPGEVGMCSVLRQDVQDVFLNSFCFGFRFREGALGDGLYFAYFFRSGVGRELLKSLAQGAIRYNLSKTALLKLAFPLPRLPEQAAIATVLSDMDAELAVLEAKLAKARAIRQGMMQEMLTGRIRLL